MNKYSEWGILDENLPLPIPNEYNPIPFNSYEEISVNKDHEIPVPIYENETEPVLVSTSSDIKLTTREDIVDETDRFIGAFAILFVSVFFLIILLNLK